MSASPAEGNREPPGQSGQCHSSALETVLNLMLLTISHSLKNHCDFRGAAIFHLSLTHSQHNPVAFHSDQHWRLCSKLQEAFENTVEG